MKLNSCAHNLALFSSTDRVIHKSVYRVIVFVAINKHSYWNFYKSCKLTKTFKNASHQLKTHFTVFFKHETIFDC